MTAAEREGRYIIALLRSFLTDADLTDEGEHDWKELYRQTCRHQMVALVYDALQKNGVVLPGEVEKKFQEKYWKAVSKDTVFGHEYACIEKAYLEQGVHMMPLKGCLLKQYYPETFYRSMSDMDILVRQEDRPVVKECMEKMGYETEVYGKDCHDVYMKPPVTNIEIHHVVVEKSYEAYCVFFQKAIDKVREEGTSVAVMSKEDTYLYLLAHMTKHFRNGGAGIRQILDVWLYWQKEAEHLDKSYLQKSLGELALENFHHMTRKLGEYWMNPPEKPVEQLEELTDFIIHNGIYGTQENSIANKIMKENGLKNLKKSKRSAIMAIFFPSWENLCTAYPILKKWPFLLPAVQVKRACKFIFFHSGKEYIRNVSELKEEKAEALKKSMDELGIY